VKEIKQSQKKELSLAKAYLKKIAPDIEVENEAPTAMMGRSIKGSPQVFIPFK
jgi:hypothetical protein